jgi:hypothetical protein
MKKLVEASSKFMYERVESLARCYVVIGEGAIYRGLRVPS